MKKLTLTILLAFIVLAGMGQNKSKVKNDSTKWNLYGEGTAKSKPIKIPVTGTYFKGNAPNHIVSGISIGTSITPTGTIVFTGGSSTPIITIYLKKEGSIVGLSPDWDTVVFTMKKENFRWINDSTAVYIKK